MWRLYVWRLSRVAAICVAANHAWRRGAHRERLDARVGRLHERRERVLHLAQVEDKLRPRVVVYHAGLAAVKPGRLKQA